MKILLTGILLIFINTLSGSSFDVITKYLSINNYKWYHYYSIGGTVSILFLLLYLFMVNGIKKNIILEKKEYYILPLARGIHFIIIVIIIFYSLEHVPINVFTMLLATTPFFLIIFAKYILKEKLNIISWFAIIIGFLGVIIVLKPDNSVINIYVPLILLVAATNAISFSLVSKYSYIASSYGYTFYAYLPFTIFMYVLFIYDPILPTFKEIILFSAAGLFLIVAAWSYTAAFHIAGKYSSIISSFLFLQIIWASIYGIIFFNEKISISTLIGFCIIITAGTVAIYNHKRN